MPAKRRKKTQKKKTKRKAKSRTKTSKKKTKPRLRESKLQKEVARLKVELEVIGSLLAETEESQRKSYLKKHPEIQKLIDKSPALRESTLLFPNFEEREQQRAWRRLSDSDKSLIRKGQIDHAVEGKKVDIERVILSRLALAELDGYFDYELYELAEEYEIAASEIYTMHIYSLQGEAV